MCFCRLCNWDFVEITKEDVESLDLNSYPASYLSHVICMHLRHPLFTTNFTKLKNSLKSIQRPHQLFTRSQRLWENFHSGGNICVTP